MYYFKTRKDTEITGLVTLTAESFVRKEPSYKKKSKNTFAVGTTARIFYMFPDSQLETDQWVNVITKNIDAIRNPKKTTIADTPKQESKPQIDNTPKPQPYQQQQQQPSYQTPIDDGNISEEIQPHVFSVDKDGVRAGIHSCLVSRFSLVPFLINCRFRTCS